MRPSLKAALQSLLIFPGAGHFFLKKYFPAAVFASTAAISLYFIIDETVAIARQVSEKILVDGTQLDYAAISELISVQTDATARQAIDIASTVLLIAWLVAIIDSYRIGRSRKPEHEQGRGKAAQK